MGEGGSVLLFMIPNSNSEFQLQILTCSRGVGGGQVCYSFKFEFRIVALMLVRGVEASLHNVFV